MLKKYKYNKKKRKKNLESGRSSSTLLLYKVQINQFTSGTERDNNVINYQRLPIIVDCMCY